MVKEDQTILDVLLDLVANESNHCTKFLILRAIVTPHDNNPPEDPYPRRRNFKFKNSDQEFVDRFKSVEQKSVKYIDKVWDMLNSNVASGDNRVRMSLLELYARVGGAKIPRTRNDELKSRKRELLAKNEDPTRSRVRPSPSTTPTLKGQDVAFSPPVREPLAPHKTPETIPIRSSVETSTPAPNRPNFKRIETVIQSMKAQAAAKNNPEEKKESLKRKLSKSPKKNSKKRKIDKSSKISATNNKKERPKEKKKTSTNIKNEKSKQEKTESKTNNEKNENSDKKDKDKKIKVSEKVETTISKATEKKTELKIRKIKSKPKIKKRK